MFEDWANKTAEQLVSRGLMQTEMCLILGGVDTGKTTLAEALTKRLAQNRPVGIIDADIGQSHIGPPATIGWAIIDEPEVDLAQLTPGGVGFVGDVTPMGHLLQFTAALIRCVQDVSKITERIIIDTPGFITDPAAAALWWTVQRIFQPGMILAVQRENELSAILAGLEHLGSRLELLTSPPEIPTKSPEARRRYRQERFREYFRDSRSYDLDLRCTTVQTTRNLDAGNLVSRVVGLRDNKGIDRAIGIIEQWKDDEDIVVVRAPQLDMDEICCLIVGDVTVNIAGE